MFLTYEQRYEVQNRTTVQVVGVSCPIWTHQEESSEPGLELFCLYRIIPGDTLRIKHRKDGYDITLPERKMTEPLSDEVWKSLTPEAQREWYATNEPQPSAYNLRNIRDGGSEWLAFRQVSKIRRKNKSLYLVHYVEIKDISLLKESLFS